MTTTNNASFKASESNGQIKIEWKSSRIGHRIYMIPKGAKISGRNYHSRNMEDIVLLGVDERGDLLARRDSGRTTRIMPKTLKSNFDLESFLVSPAPVRLVKSPTAAGKEVAPGDDLAAILARIEVQVVRQTQLLKEQNELIRRLGASWGGPLEESSTSAS